MKSFPQRAVVVLGLALWGAVLAGCMTPVGSSADEAELEQSEEAAAYSFKVMTVNVRIPTDGGERSWASRLPGISAMIRFHSPRLIGLQELQANTLQDMRDVLSQYYWPYYVDRGDGEGIGIFVDTARFTPIQWGYTNTTYEQRNDWCGSNIADENKDRKNRPVQYVLVRDVQTSRLWYLYNSHFPSKNSCERRAMAYMASEFVRQRANTSAPILFVGDLNDGVEPDGRLNTSFAELLSYTGFGSAYGQVNRMDGSRQFLTGNEWNKVARVGKMIDHVLVSPGVTVYSSWIDRSMFTSTNTRVWCDTVVGGQCPNGSFASSLKLYSDHWAVLASVAP